MNAPLSVAADRYLDAYSRVAGILPGHGASWLDRTRQSAIERFARRGFPTRRDEDWKYTSVAAIEKGEFDLLPPPIGTSLAAQVSRLALPGSHLLVFVNGRLETGLSHLGRLPAGIVLGSLAYSLDQHPGELEKELPASDGASAFSDLNLALMADGAYIRLPPGAHVKGPIQLLFLTSEANLAIHLRNLVLAGAGSSASIIEHHVAIGAPSYFTNTVTDIVLAPGASIEHYKLQQESPAAFHIAAVNVTQEADSRFVSGSFSLGAQLARVDITVGLQGAGAACDLDGLYVVDGPQHVDHHTCIDHRQPGCTSREFYKGVLNGAAHGVFNGRVVVYRDAQGSDAVQSNRNLLLSDNAEIDTKPQLEIWADDVKCSHGATVGQLDPAQIFYLRSRGIGEAAARALLSRAFAMEVIDRVRILPLQERLDDLLQHKLPRS
ncbi:Fe-S cluster assembly protein SufD [Azonexus sp. IMCC34842]|uniref:Fe-S cluster assembly protein SufD n=1 Tax=Azonexus sp. IMCC34842 TaxID=3420950 RepID=UPI003D151F7B